MPITTGPGRLHMRETAQRVETPIDRARNHDAAFHRNRATLRDRLGAIRDLFGDAVFEALSRPMEHVEEHHAESVHNYEEARRAAEEWYDRRREELAQRADGMARERDAAIRLLEQAIAGEEHRLNRSPKARRRPAEWLAEASDLLAGVGVPF